MDEARRIQRIEAERAAPTGRRHGCARPNVGQKERAMVVVMKERASDEQVEAVIAHLVGHGMDVHRSSGAARVVLGVVGSGKVDRALVALMDGVHEVLRITEPYKLASRTFKPEDTVITIGDAADRRRRGHRDGRAMLGRDRGAGALDGRGGQARRRQDAARRRLQAALVALQLPGARRRGPADAARAAPTPTTSSSSPR